MKHSRYGNYKILSKRKNRFKKFFLLVVFFLFISLAIFLTLNYKQKYKDLPSLDVVYNAWNDKNYLAVYEASEKILKKNPFDAEVLALKGFASYYIFVEKTDFSTSYEYLDQAILCLRQAFYRVKNKDKGKISYVLGKAYYQKGYYYADLAVKYLDYTYSVGLNFDDLPEFRGMAASLLGEPEKAIEAFSLALSNEPSDLLLFALAKSYMEIDDRQNAKLYFFETINKTKDVLLELKCRYLLGNIFIDEGDINAAEEEFNLILKKDKVSANACYGLGVVAELKGDFVKARSEWRKALKLDPLHEQTRIKLDLK